MSIRKFVLAAVCVVLMAPGVASAQDVSDSVRFGDDLDQNEYMITARVRAITVPNFLLDIWWDEHGSHWTEGNPNLSYGAEFVWRRGGDFELGFAIDHADLSMASAFWLDSGEDPRASDWTEVDMRILSGVFSAYWFWDVKPWFTPYFGGGVGLGIVMGDVVRYDPREDSPCQRNLGGAQFAPPECFSSDGEPDESQIDYDNPDPEENIWPAYPMIHLSGGLRFNIQDYGVLKLETGIYPYPFAGLQLGAQF